MRLLFTILFAFILSQGYGQSDALRKKHFNIKKDVAIGGYDPVSYFEGKPAEGMDNLNVIFKGITYLFELPANREKFKMNPEKFEPAYGGWCAYAMGENGEKVKIDPETYKIINGKLYLFYNFWGTNTLQDWNKNEKVLKNKGDQNWEKIFR